jgi:hypothetical protein
MQEAGCRGRRRWRRLLAVGARQLRPSVKWFYGEVAGKFGESAWGQHLLFLPTLVEYIIPSSFLPDPFSASIHGKGRKEPVRRTTTQAAASSSNAAVVGSGTAEPMALPAVAPRLFRHTV